MTHYGTIKNYDSGKGSGSIAPEKGGDALKFGKSDLQQEASEPETGQRFSYDTRQADGGSNYATNLRQQEQEQGKGSQGTQRIQAGKQQG